MTGQKISAEETFVFNFIIWVRQGNEKVYIFTYYLLTLTFKSIFKKGCSGFGGKLGTDVLIFKIYNIFAQNWRFIFKKLQKLIVTLVFKKNAMFSVGNRGKSLKLVIITSTPLFLFSFIFHHIFETNLCT
jgi:hypothetical protein